MRAYTIALAMFASLAAATASAHGPQIQITDDGGKIVTRQLILDAPYSNSLTTVKSVYVMPLLDFNNVWYSRPNGSIDPILGVPSFPSGPGFAYGYDLADGGAQLFDAGSVISLGFTSGFKRWDGTNFIDAGAMQLKAFRGSSASIASPPENFATTSDGGPFDNLALPTVAAGYGSEAAEVHTSLRFALLGDGADPLSASSDGVYLLSMQLSSTQAGLIASDPFYFVLYKNDVSGAALAVNSLGATAANVQWLSVPEPGLLGLSVTELFVVFQIRIRTLRRRS